MDRNTDIKFGLHASVSDFTSTPTTAMNVIVPESHGLRPMGRKLLDRPGVSVDNRKFPRVLGPRKLDSMPVEMFFRGVGGYSGGAVTPQDAMEQARMLDSIFGAAAAAQTGAAPTASGSAGSVLTASTNVVATGNFVLFGTSTGKFVRQVISGGGSTSLTLDRAFTGTASGTIVRLPGRWDLDASIFEHVPGYFRYENTAANLRRDYFGCTAESLSLKLDAGQMLKMSSAWYATSHSEPSPASPSFSPPTAGGYVPPTGGALWIGSSKFLMRSFSAQVQHTLSPRENTEADEGVTGYAVTDKVATFEASLYLGKDTLSLGEIRDDAGTPSLQDILGINDDVGDEEDTYDVLVQMGQLVTQVAAIRMPAASLGEPKVEPGPNGQLMINISGMALNPSTGSPFRLAVG